MEHKTPRRPGRPGKQDDLHYVFHKLEEIESKIDALGQQGGNPLLAQILTNTEQIMASVAELSAKADALQAALDTEQQQIADAFAAFQTQIADLTAQLVAGGTEAERQAVADKIDAAIADLAATIPDAPTP